MVAFLVRCRNQVADNAQDGEQKSLRKFVPEAGDEALDRTVLRRFARRDVVPFGLTIVLPLECGVRVQLGAVVTRDNAGMAGQFGGPVRFDGNANARERRVHDRRTSVPVEVVDYAGNVEPAPRAHRMTVFTAHEHGTPSSEAA